MLFYKLFSGAEFSIDVFWSAVTDTIALEVNCIQKNILLVMVH